MIHENPKEWVVVLGSGYSINQLPENLVSWINKCAARIAVNKFGYFYDDTEIIPTDLYFHDNLNSTADFFLRQSIDKLSSLGSIKFYLNVNLKSYVFRSKLSFNLRQLHRIFITNTIRFLRYTIKPIHLSSFNSLKKRLNKKNEFKDIYISSDSTVRFIEIKELFDINNTWGKSYNEILYHFRGSLTTVLNTIAIEYPNYKILMVGVDLNDNRYFFDKKLKSINDKMSVGNDWTTPYMDKEGKHFSAIEMKGVTIFDAIEYCTTNLKSTNNLVYAFPDKNAKIFEQNVNVFKI
ncbi:hypothetical protein [Nonlabens ulvanivorans]|uniref:hypothetical protein n=1 Tax=Nonlabens ulvanivorans TaxID=906888 RepID=UPI0037C7DE3A